MHSEAASTMTDYSLLSGKLALARTLVSRLECKIQMCIEELTVGSGCKYMGGLDYVKPAANN